LQHISPTLSIAAIVWLLLMIAVPIQRWIWGDTALPISLSFSVIAQVITVGVIVSQFWGVRRTLIVFAVAAALGWLIEYMGHTTGFPFGAYHYTRLLQPQIGGVPVLIPFAWLMMMPLAWAVASCVVRDRRGLGGAVRFIGVSALAFTAWDLFLDPQMVSWGVWAWDEPGAANYFGIPWVNYAGWLLASGVITAAMLALQALLRSERGIPHAGIVPLLVMYALTWLLQTGGLLFFWGLPGPAVIGFAGMGAMLAWAVWHFRRTPHG
jgi:putative membrane protein